MSMYATSNYQVTIPMLAVGPIMVAHKANTVQHWGDSWPGEWEAHIPEMLVDMIAYESGNDGDQPGFEITGSDLYIGGSTYGKVGAIDELCLVLAQHGATGIIHGECEGEFFLTELVGEDGTVEQHIGTVVYPTYGGGLLPS